MRDTYEYTQPQLGSAAIAVDKIYRYHSRSPRNANWNTIPYDELFHELASSFKALSVLHNNNRDMGPLARITLLTIVGQGIAMWSRARDAKKGS